MRALVGVFLVLVEPLPSAADTLVPTRGQDLRETTHRVDISLHDGVATYVVRRTFHNRGRLAEEVKLDIGLPPGAVATGLRIKASNKWHTGTLLRARRAEQLYSELMGSGLSDPKDPALLYWLGTKRVGLRVFPVLPGKKSTVEYTLTAPAKYADGAYHVSYQQKPANARLATPIVRIRGSGIKRVKLGERIVQRHRISLRRARLHPFVKRLGINAPRTLVRTAQSSAMATLTLVPTKPVSTQVRLGRVDLVEGKHFVNLEVDVATQLSKLPRNLSVVFVVDASHTMGSTGIAAQLRLARAYLRHVPRARFSLIGYGHQAEAWTSGFVAASAFDATVARLRAAGRLAPRNGSFLERGVALARRVLATQGPRRQHVMVVMTDNRLRPAWTNRLATKAVEQLAPTAIVHLVDMPTKYTGKLTFRRNDRHRLVSLAELRGGVAIRAIGVGSARWQPLVEQALYLVRPTRIDNVTISRLSDQNVLGDARTSVAEGSAIRWLGKLKSAPRTVTLRGQLWSKKVQLRSRSKERFNRATAGYVFAHDLFTDLSETEWFVIASYGNAVSPATSYLATEPGARPSNVGLLYDSFGRGWPGRLRRPRVVLGRPPEGQFDWDSLVGRIEKACLQGTGVTAIARVTTQGHEIANVVPTPSQGKFARCVTAKLWATQLPRALFAARVDKTVVLRFKDN